MLPVEPVIFEEADLSETLAFHFSRCGATVKAPFAEGSFIEQRPGIAGISQVVPVEVEGA